MSSLRIRRVNEVLRRELAVLLPKLLPLTWMVMTVTDVEASPDLKNARVFVSFVGGTEEDHGKVFSRLCHLRGEIQHQISRRVTMKFTPHLTFKPDRTASEATRIVQLLENIEQEESATSPPEPEQP